MVLLEGAPTEDIGRKRYVAKATSWEEVDEDSRAKRAKALQDPAHHGLKEPPAPSFDDMGAPLPSFDRDSPPATKKGLRSSSSTSTSAEPLVFDENLTQTFASDRSGPHQRLADSPLATPEIQRQRDACLQRHGNYPYMRFA